MTPFRSKKVNKYHLDFFLYSSLLNYVKFVSIHLNKCVRVSFLDIFVFIANESIKGQVLLSRVYTIRNKTITHRVMNMNSHEQYEHNKFCNKKKIKQQSKIKLVVIFIQKYQQSLLKFFFLEKRPVRFAFVQVISFLCGNKSFFLNSEDLYQLL